MKAKIENRISNVAVLLGNIWAI